MGVLSGVKLWIAIAMAVCFIGLGWTCLYQSGKIESLKRDKTTLETKLKSCNDQVKARDNLISSQASANGVQYSTAEEKCLAQVRSAYDAGRNSVGPDGLQRDIRSRQSPNAAAANPVPGKR